MENFNDVHAGDILIDTTDEMNMNVVNYDFFGNGEILCLTSERSIWPLHEFCPKFFERIKR